jgi:hypothetical protein
MKPIALIAMARRARRGRRRVEGRTWFRRCQSCGVKIECEEGFQEFERKLKPWSLYECLQVSGTTSCAIKGAKKKELDAKATKELVATWY